MADAQNHPVAFRHEGGEGDVERATQAEAVGGLRVNVPVSFGGVTFRPGEWLCADADGIVVAERPLG